MIKYYMNLKQTIKYHHIKVDKN